MIHARARMAGIALAWCCAMACGARTGDDFFHVDVDATVSMDAAADDASACTDGDPRCVATCPSTEPDNGAACGSSPLSCTFRNPCGGTDEATCDAARWRVAKTVCACPLLRPGIGAKCSAEGQTCAWTNACKSSDTGICSAGAWKINLQPCGPCPLFTPEDGSSCGTPAGCKYYIAGDSVCSTQCACDGRSWGCGRC